ncbi:Zinc finger zz-type protein [Lasiodiplodia theobromae]|uniref:Zinc finger zz-type protein n=1 Tax=Lasiodiplodia theobromae TaxID=45133 RepID=UPI0015C3C9C7|nr:Zinc finger zz-type protein [Lasiodiplodia theobromae]KAF4536547.1 Zinc finger zz-type protein [Lasiodiplodia theobromae]
MPTLKQLTCTLEKEPSRTPLTEYSTSYSDGFVETYVAVPDERTGFGIHLHSHGYIAPGLAMFVYIDGVYQCNRHRNSLLAPDGTVTPEFYEVDFHVFQQEEKVSKGKFLGRAWSFNTLAAADTTPNVTDTILGNIGTIEVVVRRLYPPHVESVLPTKPANGEKVKSTSGKQKEKQKGLKIKPAIFPGSMGFGNDGAGDQNFEAGLDGPNDDRYHDPTYYYYDDKPHRSRYYHHRRASPSPPPRRDFGPSYADYMRWRDTHPDALVHSRSRDPQRSSSYYAQYRPSGSDDSREHPHHGYTSNAYRQRRRARASDGIPQNKPRDYWVFESVNFDADDPVPRVSPIRRPSGSTSSSSATQRPLSSVIDSSAATPQARPTMQVSSHHVRWADRYPNWRLRCVTDSVKQNLNPFALGTNGLPSYRVGQPDGSLSSSTHPPDPMYNPRYPPEAPHAAPLQTHNSKTDRHDGNSKMPGGWLGEDPKDCIKAANPYTTGPINEEPSGSLFVRGATTSFPAVDSSRWGVANEHGQSSGGQEGGGSGSAAANVAGQGDAWGPSGDNSGGQDDAWGASGGNSGGQDDTWGSNGDNSGGQESGWGTSGDNSGGQETGWGTSGDNNVGGGVDQNTQNDLNADSSGNAGWGPTNGQEQTSQQGWGESGGTQQDTDTSGAWQDSRQNNNSGDAENNADQDNRWPDNTDNSSAKNNDATQDTDSKWPAEDNNAGQDTNSNWDTPNDNNAQQATDNNNNNNNSNWETQTTTAAADQFTTAPAHQSIAAPKAGSLHNVSNKDVSKMPYNSFMHKPLVPEQPFVKGYWNNWAKAPNAPPALPQRQPKQNEDAPTEIFAPSEVPYVVPEQTVREKLVDSYVHHGKGYDYAHVTGRPDYIDSWEEPYAVFRFKYRSRNMLSQILGEGGKEEMEKDKARERGEEQKRRLSLMSKDELIQQLIEKSAKAESQKAGGSQQKTPSVSSQPQPVHQWANDVAAATAPGSKAGSRSEEPMTCDRCKGNLIGEWWHCKGCGDDYDICCACVERKFRCNDDSHDLIQWKDNVDLGNGIKGPQETDKTLPGIQKGSDKKDGNAGGGSVGGGSNNDTITDKWDSNFAGNATSGTVDNTAGSGWGAVNPAGGTGGGDNGQWGAVDAGADSKNWGT